MLVHPYANSYSYQSNSNSNSSHANFNAKDLPTTKKVFNMPHMCESYPTHNKRASDDTQKVFRE